MILGVLVSRCGFSVVSVCSCLLVVFSLLSWVKLLVS